MDRVIQVVDDAPAVLEVLQRCLSAHYQVRCAARGGLALPAARQQPQPDLILLDVKLPDMHGYDVCTLLKQDALTAEIPVMFLSSHTDVGHITHGLELGAVDYVSKPVVAPILMARVRTHLRLREASELLRDQNAHLESLVSLRTSDLQARTAELQARTTELQTSQDLTIVALGSIAETRDNETGNHIRRTQAYVQLLSERLAPRPGYNNVVSADQWTMIWKSAPLHDIGKVGIPDQILLKPGRLTAEEFRIMQRHPLIGRDALSAAESRMGSDGSFFATAKEIAYAHHERWDGSGYPEGLSGLAIPLSARLMALADVYDALISKRVYKPALPHVAAVDIISEGRGRHFDPSIVDCFLENTQEFLDITARFSDDADEEK